MNAPFLSLVVVMTLLAGCSSDRWAAAAGALRNATIDDPSTQTGAVMVVNATVTGINTTAAFLNRSYHAVVTS